VSSNTPDNPDNPDTTRIKEEIIEDDLNEN